MQATSSDWIKEIKMIPVGRLCTPDEVAEVIIILTSPIESFFTGIVLPVEGYVP